jgi:hypothetical protein
MRGEAKTFGIGITAIIYLLYDLKALRFFQYQAQAIIEGLVVVYNNGVDHVVLVFQ